MQTTRKDTRSLSKVTRLRWVDIVISEVMSSNQAYLQEDGEYYDWIEIYNRGDTSVSLKRRHGQL